MGAAHLLEKTIVTLLTITLGLEAQQWCYVDNNSWARGTAVEEESMAQQRQKKCQVELRKVKEDNERQLQFGYSATTDNLICVFCPLSN